jgi:8-oxo-dGTP pyrophosphatase MutT (NUDIX family)
LDPLADHGFRPDPPYDFAMLLDPLWRAAMRVAYRLRIAWWYLRRPAIHGSYIAVWHGERVLVIENSYRRLLSFPAGGRARGETLLEAARRELREEVGITAALEELAYYGEVVHNARYAEDHGHVFELRCASAPEVRVDRREVVWAEFLSPDDALARGVVGVVRLYLEGITRSAPPPPPRRTTPPRASSGGSPSADARG